MRTIALITDFGTRDPYVAAMKGVIASRCEARIEDLTHEIAPFDVWEAAFFLRDVVAFWPEETIFVCVIDPGVGTSRRILAAEWEGRVFLAPDNGLLHFVLPEVKRRSQRRSERRSDSPVRLSDDANGEASERRSDSPGESSDWRVRPTFVRPTSVRPTSVRPMSVFSVTNDAFFLPRGSTTFHGRDRFAPVAAAIANGTPLDDLGPRISDPVMLDYEPGAIVRIDRFGNCITDIVPPATPFAVVIGAQRLDNIRTTYSGEGAFAIVGSTGCIEISVAGGSAATELHLRRGDRVTIVPA
ncbi:MAG TPA: SAM-dependent chlorinase/fluorinase [Thermoanaerobaculia bacterium]|nr:SAM-dependent chlorinase/fluorinase [Thermoanaerobaculia bacterium]